MKAYLDAFLIIASFIVAFIWEHSPLVQYIIPGIGFLIFLFLLISIRNKKNLNLGGPLNFFILNTVILLFIFSTGGISSNLFFILYFLLFGASFIMNPRSVFIFPLGVIIIFWSQILQNDITGNLVKVLSITLLSPLAYFFGTQFRHSEKEEDETLKVKERGADAAKEITKDVESVIESGKSKLTAGEMAKLNEILEETDDLRAEKK